jgi:hypothetical protein
MSWNVPVKSGGGEGFEKAPVGNHPATLVAIVGMGHQWQEPFKSGDKGYWADRAYFVWELLGVTMSGTKDVNHLIGLDLTVSLGEKAKLRKFVEARTGKKVTTDYDITQEIGQPCLLNVIANASGYPKVESVAAAPKGLPFPAPQRTPVVLKLADILNGTLVPDWVPYCYGKSIAEHVKACKEVAGDGRALAGVSAMAGGTMGGPLPF